MIADQNCIDFGTKTYRFGHFSGPSYKGAHAGWPAGWLGGRLAGWLAGLLAGCGDADLHVNKRHEHLDLHVFQRSQDVPRAGCLLGGLAAGTAICV